MNKTEDKQRAAFRRMYQKVTVHKILTWLAEDIRERADEYPQARKRRLGHRIANLLEKARDLPDKENAGVKK